jgi:hypothetical protein
VFAERYSPTNALATESPVPQSGATSDARLGIETKPSTRASATERRVTTTWVCVIGYGIFFERERNQPAARGVRLKVTVNGVS